MTLVEEFQRFFTRSDLEISYPLLYKNLQRESRDKSDIIREFDSEKYSSALEEKLFSNASAKQVDKNSLNDHVFFDGLNFKNGTKSEMLDAYFSRISLASELFFSRVENVIDLGCGSGELLIYLASKHPEKNFVGLDLSPNALKILELDASAKRLPITVNLFDMDDFNTLQLNTMENSIVFTSCLLMYAGGNMEAFFNHLFSADPSVLVFIEPISSDYLELGAWDEWAIEWFRYNRYSDLWFEQLNRILINNHKYKMTNIKRNMFAHNPLLPVSMVIVERRESLNDSK